MSDKKSNMSLYITLAIVFIIIISTLWMFFNTRDWKETTGQMNHIELQTVHNDVISPMSTNKSFSEHKIDMEYSYVVDGKAYTGTQFYPLIPNVFSDKKHADELMGKYQPNKKISVFYNPKSPANSCLITSSNITPLKYTLMIAIFLFIATVLVLGIKYFNTLMDS
ncbi:MAG: DUF3592 domain-containing protein [Gammaproteobacteria bacterium]|nr:DUF3592 domain-containing protein [Gammaproteobacteria bacterium]